MPQTMLPGSLLAMTGQTADRLIQLDSGDAALLYLYLLRRGDLRGLGWPEARLRPALEGLRKAGLAPAEETAELFPGWMTVDRVEEDDTHYLVSGRAPEEGRNLR